MAFTTVPVNVTGPSYKDRSRPLSVQETRNFYQEVSSSGKDEFVTKSFPGQKLFGSTDPGQERGSHEMNQVAYHVIGNRLVEVNSNGKQAELGNIPGTDRVIIDDDGESMFIVANGFVTEYNRILQTVTPVTDPDIVGAKSVTYINSQFAYTFDNVTVFSDVNNGASASGLNAIGADSKPDKLVRDYAFDQILYRFGTESTENWYNSGVGTPPFDRIEGQFFNVGLAAIHSVDNSRDFIYWLGSDLQVYRARAGQEQAISTAPIAGAIQSYSRVDDAFGTVFSFDDKYFYQITFPTANKTWCLIEELGKDGWFELSEDTIPGESGLGRYNAGSILSAYDKVLVFDRENGEAYSLDFNTYDQNGQTWQRRRVLGTIDSEKLGQKGKRVQMSRFELIMEKGVGTVSGQGDDPQIIIEASYDGGRSWKAGTFMRIGRLGETQIRAEWWDLRSFYTLELRMTTSDPVPYNIYSGAIDLRLAGR